MEDGGSIDQKKKSFGFNLADDKIRLIDILSEDDDFLVALPFCEDSFPDPPEVERIEQKQQNLPRRSLAWDSAFFNSAGVLDPDELSFINKGFRKTEAHLRSSTQDVNSRRSEPESTPNNYDYSVDWFEVEPSIYNPKSYIVFDSPDSGLRQEGLQDLQALMKFEKSSRTKSTARRRTGAISSHEPENTVGWATNISSVSNNKEHLSGKSYLKVDKRSATTCSRQGLVMEKISPSSLSLKYGSFSSPKFSSVVSPTASSVHPKLDPASSSRASRLSITGTVSRKSQHSASHSTSKILRYSNRNQGMWSKINNASSRSLSLLNQSSRSSLAGSITSDSLSSFVGNKQTSVESNDAKEASALKRNLQSSLRSPSQYMSYQASTGTRRVGSLSSKTLRPSGLRPPSSQRIGVFHVNSPRFDGETRSRKLPREVISKATTFACSKRFDYSKPELLPDSSIRSNTRASPCNKLKTPCSKVYKNIKRTKTEPTNTSLETGRVGDQENGKKKLSFSVDQLDNLSIYFEAIDLNREKAKELHVKHKKIDVENHKRVPIYSVLKQGNHQLLKSPVASSKACQLPTPSGRVAASTLITRTPLSDKKSTCNFSRTSMEPKKEKLVRMPSSVYATSKVRDKGYV